MLIKNIVDEDFVNFKNPSMFIGCHSCTFKCDKLSGKQVCQNSALANSPDIEISIEELVNRYIDNSITNAVVFGGLEPFDDIDNVIMFIRTLREKNNQDYVIIYTGYNEDEMPLFDSAFRELKQLNHIILKFGRFIPNRPNRYDDILGVMLHSDNQYAKIIS